MPLAPMFIEAHRFTVFNPRGTDVSRHPRPDDHDRHCSQPRAVEIFVSASGVPVVSDTTGYLQRPHRIRKTAVYATSPPAVSPETDA